MRKIEKYSLYAFPTRYQEVNRDGKCRHVVCYHKNVKEPSGEAIRIVCRSAAVEARESNSVYELSTNFDDVCIVISRRLCLYRYRVDILGCVYLWIDRPNIKGVIRK